MQKKPSINWTYSFQLTDAFSTSVSFIIYYHFGFFLPFNLLTAFSTTKYIAVKGCFTFYNNTCFAFLGNAFYIILRKPLVYKFRINIPSAIMIKATWYGIQQFVH